MKVLFFDIDGTLVSFNTHRIPDSAVASLRKLRRRGDNKIVIATGRPLSIVTNLGAIEDLIDGYVTTNGACCVAEGKIIFHSSIPEAEVMAMLEYSDRHNTALYFAGTNTISTHRPNSTLRKFYLDVTGVDTDVYPEFTTTTPEPILQVTAFISQMEEPDFMAPLPSCLATRWSLDFADVISRQSDKGRALKMMADYFGVSREDTIAFGDGGNDAPMLKAAGFGVAMGNAFPEAKAAADFITSDIDEDGLSVALKYLGLI